MDSADHHAPPGRRANRLAAMTSPYLLQHAHNPVDWWPWGPEAIAEARRRDVPIFLSIGYATCYWCHVMERESFEHEPTAAVMNERFVCVKVDREERPDIDDLYMAATVTMTGHGGWPMSVFLEPGSLRPFWCGTYFPRQPRQGMPTFTQVLTAMSEAWATQRDEVLEQARRLGDAVGAQLAAKRAPVPLGRAHAERAVQALLTMFDRTHGGFGGAPKFPQPVFLELLLEARRGADGQTASAIDAAVRSTLDAMMLGGIHDQVGGGFHRYSVDALWTVPHFEKMLYDNAQLLGVYARAAALYGDEDYARTARRTAGWMLREMVAPGTAGEAGFFSAIDAEVDGREGLNYLWTPEQVRGVLPPEDAALAISAYGLDGSPNFRDPHHPDDPPAFVLRLGERPERIAGRMGMEPDVFVRRLDAVNAALLAARTQREQPRTDDKVLTAWNAMAIAALVRAGDALGEPAWVSAAARAAGFLTGPMRPGGVLLRSSRGGQPGGPGFLEDSAFLVDALLALHASPHGGDPAHLPLAIDIARAALADFADADGALHDTRAGQADLFVRPRSAHDGAVPSGAGVMAGALLDLADATGDPAWMEHAGAALRGLSSAIHEHPAGAANACRHLLRLLRRPERPGSIDLSGAADADAAAPEGEAPVQVLADAESVTVREGEPAELHLAVSIEAPYHIVAADPGPDGAGLIPLRVGLVSGQGVAVYADYPAGEAYGVEGMGTINVHTGQIALRVALERAEGIGAGAGRPVLGVSFQACTDRACLAPRTVALSVRVEVG